MINQGSGFDAVLSHGPREAQFIEHELQGTSGRTLVEPGYIPKRATQSP